MLSTPCPFREKSDTCNVVKPESRARKCAEAVNGSTQGVSGDNSWGMSWPSLFPRNPEGLKPGEPLIKNNSPSFSNTRESVTRPRRPPPKPYDREHNSDSEKGCIGQQKACKSSPMPRLPGSSFLQYLTNSALRETEGVEVDERGPQQRRSGSEAGTLSEDKTLVSDGISSPPSRVTFPVSMKMFAREMAKNYDKLCRALLDDDGAIFDDNERIEIADVLRNIGGTVSKICIAAYDSETNLDAYNTVSDAVVSRAQLHEIRVKQLTEEVEVCVDAKREALADAARQLRNERAALKNILLQSNCCADSSLTSQITSTEVGPSGNESDSAAVAVAEQPTKIFGEVQKGTKTSGSSNASDPYLPPVVYRSGGRSTPESSLNSSIASRESQTQDCVCNLIAQVPLHELANELLRSRRQTLFISQLGNQCTAANELRMMLMQKEMENFIRVCSLLEQDYLFKKDRLLGSCFTQAPTTPTTRSCGVPIT
ncbi:uncharacterized protein TEOVI_000769000 [Trypanosoma equiperdum]|uniref:Uncharacterized protein n=1 Tax=Trypanosoma equiperdum TaxID=5694 RepID=A0A1G4I9D8_TRYEQ|nr:hypothetical protein, conserved [Trypanosoma equiperdum]